MIILARPTKRQKGRIADDLLTKRLPRTLAWFDIPTLMMLAVAQLYASYVKRFLLHD